MPFKAAEGFREETQKSSAAPVAQAVAETPAFASAPLPAGSFCIQCGASNPPEARFCASCKSRLPEKNRLTFQSEQLYFVNLPTDEFLLIPSDVGTVFTSTHSSPLGPISFFQTGTISFNRSMP